MLKLEKLVRKKETSAKKKERSGCKSDLGGREKSSPTKRKIAFRKKDRKPVWRVGKVKGKGWHFDKMDNEKTRDVKLPRVHSLRISATK